MGKILLIIKKIFSFIIDIILGNKGFIMLIAFIIFVRFYVVSIDTVNGPSMAPTLNDQEVVILDTKFYKLTKLDRFDIIVFDNDDSEDQQLLVKRIVGLPGETVEMRNNELYINGEKLECEDYIQEFNDKTFDFKTGVIPENHYFVLGDNRAISLDSRRDEVGFVSLESIDGRVVFRQEPLSEIGFIK